MIRKITVLVLVVSCFVGLLVIGGCTLSANPSTTTYYYNPNWTPNGKILCTKNVQTVSGGSGGSGGTDIAAEYYLVLMNDDGTGETNIKKIGAGGKVAASPLGNYYAYTEGNYVKVVDTSGNDVSSINAGATTDSLDWGPDESKLAYGIKTSATSEIYTVNRDGSGLTFLAVGENVAWKYGTKIIFEYLLGIYTSTATINQDGTNKENIEREDRVISPQILSSNTNEAYGTQGTEYGYIDISLNPKVFNKLFDNFNGYLPKLSKNGDKVVYTDYSLAGIYLINITGTGEIKIK